MHFLEGGAFVLDEGCCLLTTIGLCLAAVSSDPLPDFQPPEPPGHDFHPRTSVSYIPFMSERRFDRFKSRRYSSPLTMNELGSKRVNVQHQHTHSDKPTHRDNFHRAPSFTPPVQPYPRDHSAYSSQPTLIIKAS